MHGPWLRPRRFCADPFEEKSQRIYAVDVSYGILDYKLRINERVRVLERRNLRNLNSDWLLEEDQLQLKEGAHQNQNHSALLVTSDASFISAQTVLSSLQNFQIKSHIDIEAFILIKPQFESSKETVKGIIRDPDIREKLVANAEKKAKQCGFQVLGITPVFPTGARGNQEYMLYAVSSPLS